MTERPPRTGFAAASVVTAVVGLGVAGATVMVERGRAAEAGRDAESRATVELGRRLIRDTGALLGPSHADPERRYSGTHMACASCHLETGTSPGTLSLLVAAPKYPSFSGREGRDSDLKDRINGCMQRSMNGKPLPGDSVEMLAMEAYIRQLGGEYAVMGETRKAADEQPPFREPDRRADPEAGRAVFDSLCAVCHGADGLGFLANGDPVGGYLFPPLWGPESYNDGAGMHRVLTAARFIKAKMPLGEADLTDDEAFDVSAYINSQPRPAMSGLDADYPDRATKPIDSPYPPYADPFPRDQHRFGPFRPIREYYERLRTSGSR